MVDGNGAPELEDGEPAEDEPIEGADELPEVRDGDAGEGQGDTSEGGNE